MFYDKNYAIGGFFGGNFFKAPLAYNRQRGIPIAFCREFGANLLHMRRGIFLREDHVRYGRVRNGRLVAQLMAECKKKAVLLPIFLLCERGRKKDQGVFTACDGFGCDFHKGTSG